MHLFSLMILRWNEDTEEPILLSYAFDLSSFSMFQRSSTREFMIFFAKTITKRTNYGEQQTVESDDGMYFCHTYCRADGLCGLAVCDREYPQRVAYGLIRNCLSGFDDSFGDSWRVVCEDNGCAFRMLDERVREFQDPADADKITRIQRDLEDTKEVLHKTIDSVLERGVKLDSLVERSNDLSKQSKMFYNTAKKQNRCCVIM